MGYYRFFGDIFVAQYTSNAWQFIQDYNRLYALLISHKHKHITFTPTHFHKWKLCLSAIHITKSTNSLNCKNMKEEELDWINFCRCYFLSLSLLIWNLNFFFFLKLLPISCLLVGMAFVSSSFYFFLYIVSLSGKCSPIDIFFHSSTNFY